MARENLGLTIGLIYWMFRAVNTHYTHVAEQLSDMPLLILHSPYRTLEQPLMDYPDSENNVHQDDLISVILPEFVPARWWHHFLHNAHGWILRLRLFYRRDIIITSVRYYLDR